MPIVIDHGPGAGLAGAVAYGSGIAEGQKEQEQLRFERQRALQAEQLRQAEFAQRAQQANLANQLNQQRFIESQRQFNFGASLDNRQMQQRDAQFNAGLERDYDFQAQRDAQFNAGLQQNYDLQTQRDANATDRLRLQNDYSQARNEDVFSNNLYRDITIAEDTYTSRVQERSRAGYGFSERDQKAVDQINDQMQKVQTQMRKGMNRATGLRALRELVSDKQRYLPSQKTVTTEQQFQSDVFEHPTLGAMQRLHDGQWKQFLPAKSTPELEQQRLSFEQQKLDDTRNIEALNKYRELTEESESGNKRDPEYVRQIIHNMLGVTIPERLPFSGEQPLPSTFDMGGNVMPQGFWDQPAERQEAQTEVMQDVENDRQKLIREQRKPPSERTPAVNVASIIGYEPKSMPAELKRNPFVQKILAIHKKFNGKSPDHGAVRYAAEIVLKSVEVDNDEGTSHIEDPFVGEAIELLMQNGLTVK